MRWVWVLRGQQVDRRCSNAQRLPLAMRARLFKKFKGLEIDECPFANLPEARSGRWGQGLTKAKSGPLTV
jgi:hypothetical protein